MSIENDAIRAAAEEEQRAAEMVDEMENAAEETSAAAGPSFADLFAWLKTPTGPGGIESYINHPLNAKSSRGVAQMLRGFTGLFGALDLAVIDIALGGFAVMQEKKAVAESAVDDEK